MGVGLLGNVKKGLDRDQQHFMDRALSKTMETEDRGYIVYDQKGPDAAQLAKMAPIKRSRIGLALALGPWLLPPAVAGPSLPGMYPTAGKRRMRSCIK